MRGRPNTIGKGLFEEASKAQNRREGLLKDGCKPSFGTLLNNFGPKATQMNFGPKATQMLQMVSFGNILQYFGLKDIPPVGVG